MTTRPSIIIWSTGSGLLLGLFIDAAIVGVWALLATAFPAAAPRHLPKWAATIAVLLLIGVPLATGLLGYLEGQLKAD